MFVFGLLAALVAYVNAGFPMHDGRVFGMNTTIEKYPHQVSLEWKKGQPGEALYCGGSIYSDKYVITSARCVTSASPGQIQVRVGNTQRETDGQVLAVAAVKASESLWEDVAIVQLADLITFGPKALPVILVSENKDLRPGEIVTVSGWGNSTVLQDHRLPVMDRTSCEKFHPGSITEKMTCTGGDGKTAWMGEVGGPLINDKRELVGVVSYLPKEDDLPEIYTNVADPVIRNFILENTH